MFANLALVTLLAATVVQAAVVPLTPGPGNEGATCTVSWQGDAASTEWGSMAIQLMTGDNLNMVHLTTITSEMDGTIDGQFDYPCPDVSINSAIYFYQFTSPATPEKTWTTRFTIAGPDGSTVPPENPLQSDGEPIPWGVGALADPSAAVPPPPNGTPTGSNSTLTTSRPITTPTLTPTTSSRTTRSLPATSAANATRTSGASANGAVAMVDPWKLGVMVVASVFALAFAL